MGIGNGERSRSRGYIRCSGVWNSLKAGTAAAIDGKSFAAFSDALDVTHVFAGLPLEKTQERMKKTCMLFAKSQAGDSPAGKIRWFEVDFASSAFVCTSGPKISRSCFAEPPNCQG